MITRTTLRNFLRRRVVTIEQFMKPDFYCPEMLNYELLYSLEDLRFEAITQGLKPIDIPRGMVLDPVGLKFGMSKQDVKKKLGKPFMAINNSSNVKEHEILLYKRRLGKSKATTQVHLSRGKVRMVVDEFSKVYIPNVSFVSQIAAGLGLSYLKIESGPNYLQIYEDERGNVLKIEEGISIMFLWVTR